MKTLAYFRMLLLVFLVTSCEEKPSELKLAASKLKEGMTKNEVRSVFTNCPITGTNVGVEIEGEMKLFSSNRVSALDLIFREPSFDAHFCVVYFDTNDIIMAYKLEGLYDAWPKQ